MNLHNRLLAGVLATVVATYALAHSGAAPSSMTADKTGFEENKGQVRTTEGNAAAFVRYRLSQGNTQLFLLENGIAYQFSRMHYPEGYAELMAGHDPKKQEQLDAMRKQIRLETYRMDMLLEGANVNANITTEGRSSDYTQYYNHDALDVHTYSKVTYHEIYPGIDWVVYTTEKGMKYDFVVRPGADPDRIRMRFEHHEELSIDAVGNLIHGNRMGRFTEERPVSFQDGKEVPTSFVLEGDRISFAIGVYDTTRELTIDPELMWATYYGADEAELGHDCTVDGSGNVFLAGNTISLSGIASGGHQNTYGGGFFDAFLVKFNSSGVRQWGTYYGGSNLETGLSSAADAEGNVYLSGGTLSTSGIAFNGHQNTLGGLYDAFLVKFNASGVRQWATYYGGAGSEDYGICAVDGSGNVFLAGPTNSNSTSAIASGGHDGSFGGGNGDAYLAKFNANGVRQWSTYYGGAGDDGANNCAVDGSGNVFLAGYTTSTSDISSGGHQSTLGGLYDAFLVKFNASGTRLWGTYYGGDQDEYYAGCAAEGNGNVFLAATTGSTSGIASGGHQNSLAGDRDGLLVKFDPSGIRQWATYYGGPSDDLGRGCAVDGSGNAYLSGQTSSYSGIAFDGHQMNNAGAPDLFLVRFSSNGSRQWATYYGGSGIEAATGKGVATGSNDVVCLAGTTWSSSGIAFNGHQSTNSDQTAFLAKFGLDIPEDLTTGSIMGSPFCQGDGLMVPFTASDIFNPGNTFTAQLSDASGSFAAPVDIGSLSGTTSGTISVTIPPGTTPGTGYRIRVIGSDPATIGTENDAPLTVTIINTWYPDEDGDGYGAPTGSVETCTPTAGYVLNSTDDCPTVFGLIGDTCDDNDATTENDIITEECECEGVSILPQIVGYRYWFDDDIANATTVTVEPVPELQITEAFIATGLDGGLRKVSVQALDNTGHWSSPQTSLFARVDGVVSSYRYWVNDDPSNMQTVNVTPVEVLDLSTPLAIGTADRPFNMLTIQFMDGAGVISVPYTTTFVRSTGPIVEYEYWIDDAIVDRISVDVGPAEVVDLIDDLPITAALGAHVFTIRFRGESGAWSVPLTTSFMMEAIVYDCPVLEANIGDPCDPGPGFENGQVTEACECVGTPLPAIDCNGVLGGPAQPGTPCDDLDDCTVNDVYTGAFPNCGCAGTFADADNDGTCDANDLCPGGAEPGTSCDDNSACTTNDVVQSDCSCAGTPVDPNDNNACTIDTCDPILGVINTPIDPDDGNPCTLDSCDPITGVSNIFQDADNDGTCDASDLCPGGPEPGTACDDNNANTVGDVIGTNCMCAGTPIGGCNNDLILKFQSGLTNPDLVTYEVLDETGTSTILSGNNPVPANGVGTQTLCLVDGCYQLRVTDAAGDGLLGYELRESGSNGRRIIDNSDNMSNGISSIANGGTFCLPLGDIELIYSNCDKLDWVNYQYLVCHADANVSANWLDGTQNNDGYVFWIFDPNGSYSFRRFHTHAVSDGFSPANATRAAHMKINGWNNSALTPHIPAGVLLNVRVRGVYNWNFTEWGPACTMKIDPATAACPQVWLQDDPSNTSDYSCGVTRNFGGPNSNTIRITAKPPQFQPAPLAGGTGVRYQFRFRLPAEGVCIVRPPQTSATLNMNWSAASGPQLEASKTYEVEVRVSKDQGATWCVDAPSPACDPSPVTNWGKTCSVTIASVVTLAGESSSIATQGDGTFSLYPNPNNGEQLFISLTELGADVSTVSVDIYDLTGKRITARTIAVAEGFLNTALELNGELANGLYMVNITAGAKVYNERLVIQK